MKEREILVKQKAETSEKFGISPSDRAVKGLLTYGVVDVDKPEGPTSHQVSAYVRSILKCGKAGHSGTLDPKVTGVLPVALGKATRVTSALLSAGKEYVCLMRVLKPVDEKKLREVLKSFVGKIKQLPPKKSAVKRQQRYRSVYYLEVLEIQGQDVLFVTGTQAGTYIRKLCHDIGVKLGVGANMAELRRTKAGPFKEETLCTMQDLTDAYHFYMQGDDKLLKKLIMPVEKAVGHLPKIWIIDTAVDSVCHGASLKVPGIAKLHEGIEPDMKVAVMTLKDELVMTATARLSSKKLLEEERGVAAKTDQVFMKPGTYPRIEKS